MALASDPRWSTDPRSLRRYFVAHPVQSLNNRQLKDEYLIWDQRRKQLWRESDAPWILQLLNWGGLGMAVVGIPMAFAVWQVGLPFALVGLTLQLIGGLMNQSYEKAGLDRLELTNLIMHRRRLTYAEMKYRYSKVKGDRPTST